MVRYFISDLHLQPSTPELTQAFDQFMVHIATDADELYILGDFFDAWIGDDEDHPFYTSIVEKLKHYSDNGLKLYFLHGNRDFLVGQGFANRTGCTLLPETTILELAGKQVLLMHGDSLCTTDIAYMQFRTQVRDPQWQQQVLAMPLPQRRAMAAQMRAQSQAMNSNKTEDIMDVNPSDVTRSFADFGVDILLHGHTHRPARHTMTGNKERIVLGDWGNTGWYVKADNTTIELVEFAIDNSMI